MTGTVTNHRYWLIKKSACAAIFVKSLLQTASEKLVHDNGLTKGFLKFRAFHDQFSRVIFQFCTISSGDGNVAGIEDY